MTPAALARPVQRARFAGAADSGLISGRPGPPFSRAISSRSAATSRRSSAPSSKSFNTKLLSSAGESASMSGGDIPPSSQKTDDSGILPSPHESIRRTYRPTPSQRSPGLLPLLLRHELGV